ncbi:MAG TPA: cupredoxin domain-containing protein [candidate division Zixibacteria bacterium]|nr:cupredoxin domain-containing protein [candidate division Zixibacteria bacterium]
MSLLLAACSAAETSAPTGGTGGEPPADCVRVENGVIAISANNMEFDAPCMVANAGEAFTIEFTNMESVPHNVAVYTDSSTSEELGKTEIITGPDATAEVEVGPLDAGEYWFDCQVHPTQMNGTLYVVEA